MALLLLLLQATRLSQQTREAFEGAWSSSPALSAAAAVPPTHALLQGTRRLMVTAIFLPVLCAPFWAASG